MLKICLAPKKPRLAPKGIAAGARYAGMDALKLMWSFRVPVCWPKTVRVSKKRDELNGCFQDAAHACQYARFIKTRLTKAYPEGKLKSD